jgi:acylphosphatase
MPVGIPMSVTPNMERSSAVDETSVVHALIHGGVQGVGFRAWVQHQAELRGLGGWVRNRRDGTVEAVFSGPTEAVEAMLAACRHGPAGATVNKVERDDDPAVTPRPTSDRFDILGTI